MLGCYFPYQRCADIFLQWASRTAQGLQAQCFSLPLPLYPRENCKSWSQLQKDTWSLEFHPRRLWLCLARRSASLHRPKLSNITDSVIYLGQPTHSGAGLWNFPCPHGLRKMHFCAIPIGLQVAFLLWQYREGLCTTYSGTANKI